MLLLQCLALHKTHIVDGLNTHDHITRDQMGPNVHQPRTKNPEDSGYKIEHSSDQIGFCAFYSFLKGVQTKLAIDIPTMHACVIAAWRL